MARQMQRLSSRKVTMAKVGYHCDGGGLYLQVTPSGAKSWIFRYTLEGKSREMGLGPLHTVSLANARLKATSGRDLLLQKKDPIKARDADDAVRALDEAKSTTFSQCATSYIKAHKSGWRNGRHANQWNETLEKYVYPIFGNAPVQEIDTSLVLKVLEPIWTDKTVTAGRVRGRIEAVLDWAKARGYRAGENPARWRGHLENLLSSIVTKRHVEHYAAMPFDEVGEFMATLRAQKGTAARALEFLVLCAARTSEVTGALPGEFDLDKAVWTIPAVRMKAGKEHRVPLCPRAVAIVQEQLKLGETYVFPSRRAGKPLGGITMFKLLNRKGHSDVTVHGFRSSFRDWTAERTSYPREVCEMALAHAVGDKVEAAYRRGDLFEKRRRLALEWAKHCEQTKKAGQVTPIRKAN